MSPHPPIKVRRLTSKHLRATVLSQGAALQSLVLRRAGREDVELVRNLGTPMAYRENPEQVGVVVGRVAGRIAKGQFKMGARRLLLETNENGNTLHGGPLGFGQVAWRWAGGASFSLSSPHGDQGFPGRLEVRATYTLPDDLTFRLDLQARARAATPINLTHHPYWKLFDGRLKLLGEEAQAVDMALIPTGGYVPKQATLGAPLDHCFRAPGTGFRHIVHLDQPGQGFAMEVWSDASHVQVYNGYDGHVCLEPQTANDAVNQPEEPSCILNPGQIWTRRIEYRFALSDTL